MLSEDTASPPSEAAVTETPAGTAAGFGEEIITTGLSHRTKVTRDYVRQSGFRGLLSIGSVGSYVFSSGIILVVTGALLVLYSLACVILPFVLLFGLYGGKGTVDDRALKMKRFFA